jgi:signal peptidase II
VRSLRRFGIAVAAATLIADQAAKFIVLQVMNLSPGVAIPLAPFLDLSVSYNRGISYGLWPQDGDLGRYLLIAISLAAAGLFVVWLGRTGSWLAAVALGFLIGGAIGNAVDRVIHGAVVDFVSLHAFGWRWYVFNVADSAIVAGVVGLLYDALFGGATKRPPSTG